MHQQAEALHYSLKSGKAEVQYLMHYTLIYIALRLLRLATMSTALPVLASAKRLTAGVKGLSHQFSQWYLK